MARTDWPAKVIRSALSMPWTLVMGALLGLLVAPASFTWWHGLLSYYDDARPVVRMTGHLVARDGDSVLVTFTGEKLRACSYIRIQAYTIMQDDALEDAYIKRADMPERGDTKPLGLYTLGTWKIWPISGAKGVRVYVQHDCAGRLVQTQIGNILFDGSLR